jgi:hypothetical protein
MLRKCVAVLFIALGLTAVASPAVATADSAGCRDSVIMC